MLAAYIIAFALEQPRHHKAAREQMIHAIRRCSIMQRSFIATCTVCSLFVLIMGMKSKLGNVSFGGNGSEDLLALEAISSVLAIIDQAAEDCAEFDVNCEQLSEAVNFVSCNAEKGAMLGDAWRKALRQPDPLTRQQEARRIAD